MLINLRNREYGSYYFCKTYFSLLENHPQIIIAGQLMKLVKNLLSNFKKFIVGITFIKKLNEISLKK